MGTMNRRTNVAGNQETDLMQAKNSALRRTMSVALWTTRGAALTLLGLGLYVWTGNGDELIPIHIVIGVLLVLSLWTIATIAARFGASRVVVALAVAWSIGAALLGLIQDDLVIGAWHWTIQALHLVIAMAIVGWSQYLVTLVRRPAR